MINQLNRKIRTVTVNDRGQIVIPEDIREDFNIKTPATLVLVERENEIVLKKEKDILKTLAEEEKFLGRLSQEFLRDAWYKEDDIWDKIYKR